MKHRYFITGGAGFIGSNLADRLLEEHEVVVYDNFSTGSESFLETANTNSKFRLVAGDLLDFGRLKSAMAGCDFVFHLAANADVRFGLQHPQKDIEQNTIATFNVLEAMRLNGVSRIAMASTGSIYGEAKVIPTPEDASFPIQTSLYGASKLAGEGFIQAYCEGFGFSCWIFRLVGILGERYTHGHIFDLYQKLLSNPRELTVLGNGTQRKSYLYVQDCIDAMLLAIDKAGHKVNIFNLGTDEYCRLSDSVSWITNKLGLHPQISYGMQDRGWPGDNPFIYLDTRRIRSLGWQPRLTIQEAVIATISYLQLTQQVDGFEPHSIPLTAQAALVGP